MEATVDEPSPAPEAKSEDEQTQPAAGEVKQEEEAQPEESKQEEPKADAGVSETNEGVETATKEEGEIEPAAPASATEGGDDVAKETAPVEKKEAEVKEKPKQRPRNKVRSTNPVEGVDIAFGDSNIESEEPITFGQQFKITMEQYADTPALKWKVEEEGEGGEKVMVWKSATFKEYYEMCIGAAKSLIKVNKDWYSCC